MSPSLNKEPFCKGVKQYQTVQVPYSIFFFTKQTFRSRNSDQSAFLLWHIHIGYISNAKWAQFLGSQESQQNVCQYDSSNSALLFNSILTADNDAAKEQKINVSLSLSLNDIE